RRALVAERGGGFVEHPPEDERGGDGRQPRGVAGLRHSISRRDVVGGAEVATVSDLAHPGATDGSFLDSAGGPPPLAFVEPAGPIVALDDPQDGVRVPSP